MLQQQSAAPGMADVVVHKRQAVIDRLKRRMEGYRRHNQDCVPRYSNAFAEQQNVQETLMLKQKYMETKTKRNVKKNDKKPMENGNTMPVRKIYFSLITYYGCAFFNVFRFFSIIANIARHDSSMPLRSVMLMSYLTWFIRKLNVNK